MDEADENREIHKEQGFGDRDREMGYEHAVGTAGDRTEGLYRVDDSSARPR